ncbi:M20 metallopeptidase family protein [Chitinophaga nivalis]|uniref:M20 family metallopeptidase n=1 Tax=Chitinophaga nivalis TaxID=2991709 RepID=A0ABT3IML1_9BACT|nr:M20 family metallopeptidase [Chitinophaga nivalis]MCW3465107.1 M20 family metallopeptidase [Chitinophaga nivalis]MCW3485201.1 M20 family metallopeptidase [Chitinophaga nivalis]
MLKERIRQLAREQHATAVAHRRHIHANPELSYQEYETAAFVEARLRDLGIPFERMANTGIVALLEGALSPSDQVVALRADMDALPIRELNNVPYKSQKEGVMHACGHDVHTASLLATAGILSRMKDEFSGTVKFIFQPAEEVIPGGASLLIKAGVLENPRPHHILGQHVMPEMPAGKVGFRLGRYMASNDEITMVIKGKGGHGAMPHLGIDPVLIACHTVIALQQIVSRRASPLLPTVLSFGKMIANGAANVIPDEVRLEGTFRSLDETWRTAAHEKIKKMAVSIAESMEGTCDITIERGYPVLINDDHLTAASREHAIAFLGADNVLDLDIWMAAEDFASYSQQAVACFYRLGVRNEDNGITSGLHTATFDADESALETGAGLMTYLALKTLGH